MPAHGLMFHHFSDARHPRGQGAIDAEEFAKLLDYVGRDRILPAADWLERSVAGKLRDDDLCVTFDDNLRCQFDVARPVLDAFGITAFWFVYTSPLEGVVERLEAYRHFRTIHFPEVEDFYRAFFAEMETSEHAAKVAGGLASFDPKRYLAEYPFYTDEDRKFRFVRDQVLGPVAYFAVMDGILQRAHVDLRALHALLWMDADCLRRLKTEGHVIGLHSHTHPTDIAALDAAGQREEYAHNRAILEHVVGAPIRAVSHPCNSYNATTLGILRDLGIAIGFRSNMAKATAASSPMEMPREDHANLLRRM